MKAIVIQGGGSYGAYSLGRIAAAKNKYDVAIGSSTGALIAPFLLSGRGLDLSKLINSYTTISNKDVYEKYPFYKNGLPNIPYMIYRFAIGAKGITSSKPLRELIKTNYTPELHVINADKHVYITVCELNKNSNRTLYCKSSDYSYDTFCDMIWASTLVPGLFEPLTINGVDYVDGGTTENVGLKKAIQLKCEEIDVYLHITEELGYSPIGKNWIHNLIRSVKAQRDEVVESDLLFGKNNVNLHYLKSNLEGAGIMEFNPEVMLKWFNKGYNEYSSR